MTVLPLPIGTLPAAITPMLPDGRIDEVSLVRLLAWFRVRDCAGVVVAGTNGEGPSLSAVEKRDLVSFAVGHSLGLPVIAGIATHSLEEAKWLLKQAGKSGAAAALLMAPSYFGGVSVDGLGRWFEACLDHSPIPVLAYNFPQRTGLDLPIDLLKRLAGHPNLAGAKDSSVNAENLGAYREALPNHRLYVGAEILLLDALRAGWTGSISGAANCVPSWLAAVVRDFAGGRLESAETKFELIAPILRELRNVPQPGFSKAFHAHLGTLSHGDLRLPLLQTAPDEALIARIERLQPQ